MPAATAPSPRPVGLPPVSLAALAAHADLSVSARSGADATAVRISGITLRSADVRPGDLFAALPGSTTHGAVHAGDAARGGAAAVLTDSEGYSLVLRQQAAADLPVLIAERPRAVIGPLAAAIYDHPSRKLAVIGVTGTSGKTTTCYLIEAALAAAGRRTGLIGTVAVRIDGQALPSALTTPEAPDLQALFAVMAERGVTAVAMEVSSHALALGRVSGVEFAVGAFTNLSQDHLDFHGDMESYFAAKRLLFDGRAAAEVVVVDDEYGRRLAAARPRASTVSTRRDAPADWTVTDVRGVSAEPGIQRCTIAGPAGLTLRVDIALPGAFNVANAATALACVAAAGIDPSAGAPGLARVTVPGRMERVDRGQPFLALVDYAHKPAALGAVLDAVRDHCTGRVIVVIGAGGDRDHGKRPLMGAVAARGAELVIVTDDNPRSEDPAAIRSQILAGAAGAIGRAGAASTVGRAGTGAVEHAEVREIGDRRDAIGAAVAAAAPGDVVLIAGKGHEEGQEIAGHVHPFSDRDELAAALAARFARTGARP